MNLIIDTDLGFDYDDAAAIAIANIYAKAEEADILAITHCINTVEGGKCIKMINDYYGNDIEIGISNCSRVDLHNFYERYYKNLSYSPSFKGFDRKPSFYNYIKPFCAETNLNGITFQDSTELIKRKLFSAEDNSVTIVCIGQQNNIACLLNNEYSGYGNYSNINLLKNKLKKIIIMGGNFSDYDDFYEYGDIRWHSEFNIYLDIESAKKVAAFHDLPIDYIDFNQGCNVLTGKGLLGQDNNPVKKIYEFSGTFARPSWDLITVLYALEGQGKLFDVSERGKVQIDDRGKTTFIAKGGNHRLVLLRENDVDIALLLDNVLSTKKPLMDKAVFNTAINN